MANINKLMKQAARMQQQMQEQMAQTQEELASRTVEASSGGGAVTVTATCDGAIKSIRIKPEAMDPEDAEVLEDMVLSAVNSALEEGRRVSGEEMGKITEGMGLPGGGGLPGLM